MKPLEYAIVDIETTGGNAESSRITEIAVIIHDGQKIIERWESLINPERNIPQYIFALTGISNEMVWEAPTFANVAKDLMQLLENRIFVAHNVNFDYSFIRYEFTQAGFDWTASKLCTVRATRKIRPGMRSYGLGNLCNDLNIPVENRHRAGGDCDATAILFSRLIEWDVDGEILKMIKKNAPDQRLPPHLPPDDFKQLPEMPGVYYFHDQAKKVVYVGKAVNIKKRVASHFTGNKVNAQRQGFLRDIHSISYEVCATELMALLLECSEIRKLWPKYNSALKRFEPKFGLYEYEARSGYRYLAIDKVAKFQECITVFNYVTDGIELLQKLSSQFNIDCRFCKYGISNDTETVMKPTLDDLPTVQYHNQQVQNAIDFFLSNRRSFALVDKGRSTDERSCIWVENGHFYGMGYMSADVAICEAKEVREYVTQYHSNQYIMQLIRSEAEKFPEKVLVELAGINSEITIYNE